MFPLGSVLVPGMPLPLHVFEPRYRALVEHCLERRAPFGVALIERGIEVGGGDVRFDVGCLAEIADSHRFDDGRYAILGIGIERIEVTEWLADDPYPRARVRPWPDDPDEGVEVAPGLVGEVTALMRRTLAQAIELGDAAADATGELSEDAVVLGWQVAAGGPIQPIDRLRLLSAPGPVRRLSLARDLLIDLDELLALRLGAGSDPDGP